MASSGQGGKSAWIVSHSGAGHKLLPVRSRAHASVAKLDSGRDQSQLTPTEPAASGIGDDERLGQVDAAPRLPVVRDWLQREHHALAHHAMAPDSPVQPGTGDRFIASLEEKGENALDDNLEPS